MKRKRKSHLGLFMFALLCICALLIWCFRKELLRIAGFEGKKSAPQEKISNEDRKQLENILKRR